MSLIRPRLDPQYRKTYAIARPHATHTRIASCHEAGCERRLKGWRMMLNLADAQQLAAARWIKNHSARAYVVEAQQGDLVTLRFEPAQDCFETHRIALERDPIFVMRDGDHRGNPRGTAAQTLSASAWRDNFGEHQETLADAAQRG